MAASTDVAASSSASDKCTSVNKDASYFGAELDIGPWPRVQVVIVEESVDAAKAAVAEINAEAGASPSSPFVLGVDMEWVALKRTGKAKEVELRRCPTDFWTEKVSLVQIATAKKVYLFRLCSFPSSAVAGGEEKQEEEAPDCAIPAPLVEVLLNADQRFVFAGVGVDGDRTRVARDFGGLSIAPCLDIVKAARHLASSSSRIDVAAHPKAAAFLTAGSTEQKTCNSLADFASKIFDFALPKDLAVTCSNWTQRRLDAAQIFYAAADAFASHQLAVTLLEVFGVKPSGLLELCATSTPLKEVKPKAAKGPSQTQNNNNNTRKPAAGTYSGRKQPYYGNIKVLEAKADEGIGKGSEEEEARVLFTVSTAKADWYIKEELATVVNPGVNNGDGTYTGRVIQLKFRPNLDRGDEDRALRPDASFFAADKENCCVVCADDDPPGGVVRFFVVPQAYRKFFPREFVNHNSFDIVLVCVACMKKVNVLYEAERKALEDSFKYPISWHSVKTINEMKRAESDEAGGDAAAPPSTGLAVAEHNRTILNMGKSATALVMAFAAGESVSATSRAKNKVVSLPPDRFAMLVNSIDEHLPTYIFPDAVADIETHGTTHYKGKPHWHDKYWQLLKDKHDGSEATTSLPIVLPTTGEPCANKTSWRDVYNVMRAERWKVKLRNSAIQNPDGAAADDDDDEDECGTAAAAAASGASVGASHFEFVVNEIMRTAVVGGATVGAPFTLSCVRQPSAEETEWVAHRAAANGGTLGAAKPDKPKSGKPGQGADTPRAVLEAVCRFIFRWRSMFQDGLSPKRMPQGWYPRQGLIGLPPDPAVEQGGADRSPDAGNDDNDAAA